MHRAVLLATGANIDADAIYLSGQPEEITPVQAPTPQNLAPNINNPLVGRSMESVEQELIIDTLNYCLGNRTHAANILGISIRTLRNKLKAYGENGISVPTSIGDD